MYGGHQPVSVPAGPFTAALLGLVVLGLTSGQLAPVAQADSGELARKFIDRGEIGPGVCTVLGCDRDFLMGLVRTDGLLVYVREPKAAAVADLKARAEAANVGIDQLVIGQGPLDSLPHADNLVDLVAATQVSPESLPGLSLNEILRVLRPGGIAIIGKAQSGGDLAKLEAWAKSGTAERVTAWEDATGKWVEFFKPVPEGMDDWPTWEHGPDNNPVSTDRVIKAPYMTQFLADPRYICMPAITTAAGGRTFLATGHIAHHRREWDTVNKLIARNGYNGTVLWQRDLPDSYLSHRSAFVATADTFHMLDGDSCLMLDAATGQEKGRIHVPGTQGHWKWMMIKDGVMYVMAGPEAGGAKPIRGDRVFGGWSWADLSQGYYQRPQVPWGFGNTVAAYDLEKQTILWMHSEDKPIDSRAMATSDDKLYIYCPESKLRCLDAATGEILWTTTDPEICSLIEEPGKGLTSTPGFRSCCLAVASDKAVIIQGQTRANVVAVSPKDGSLLWTKKKITNNPNVLFVDGKAVLGVGPGGSHVVIDPLTGEVLEDLKFRKVSCARLTACEDSFFVRGEGTLRFDRQTKKVLVDGAVRPACNDGALPANGMLYLGPWQCDCNLSLIGAMGKCSAGEFRFDHTATDEERLTLGEGDVQSVAPLETAAGDWPTYRGNNQRSASTSVKLARPNQPEGTPRAPAWAFSPPKPYVPTPPVLAGGIVFVGGDDGKLRAVDSANGQLKWQFATGGPIKASPTVSEGRAYVGSGDGNVYCLEAASGRFLWKFQAAPVDRLIMVYGNLTSTWPVNTGVLVHESIAYFGAGIIDYDGTYIYALDAKTGKIKWQNNSTGHLSDELRKGISAQGNMSIKGDLLLMAGGNQITPARFDLATGECINRQAVIHGTPSANHGKFSGVLFAKYPVTGGRTMYGAPENVANKDSFVVNNDKGTFNLAWGGIPPAWNEKTVAFVNHADAPITCCDSVKVANRVEEGYPALDGPGPRHWRTLADALPNDGAVLWTSDLGRSKKFEAVSIAVCPDAVVAVAKFQNFARAHPQWCLTAFMADNGQEIWFWRHELPMDPLPGGLLVGPQGQVVLTALNGTIASIGPRQPPAERR